MPSASSLDAGWTWSSCNASSAPAMTKVPTTERGAATAGSRRSDMQVALDDALVGTERPAVALPGHPPLLDHVVPVGERQQRRDVIVDHPDGDRKSGDEGKRVDEQGDRVG